jgi:HEPN domain-containing protein
VAESANDGDRWLRYATEDLSTAESILAGPTPNARHACYLAQQAAEKALKSILIHLQLEYPFSHDLDMIRNRIPAGWRVKIEHPTLGGLTDWAFSSRYPTEDPDATMADAREACDQARAVLDSVVRDLRARGLAT